MSPISNPAHWHPDFAASVVILDVPSYEISATLDALAQRPNAILADATVSDGHHLVIADRQRRHRVWIRSRAFGAAATHTAPIDDYAGSRLAATLQFNRWLHGSGPQLLHPLLIPTAYQRQRLVKLLRIADAQVDGTTLREIAYAILFPNHRLLTVSEWRGSSERRACHRLAATANRLILGDYRKLLAA